MPSVVVAGAGPGPSRSTADRSGREGYRVVEADPDALAGKSRHMHDKVVPTRQLAHCGMG